MQVVNEWSYESTRGNRQITGRGHGAGHRTPPCRPSCPLGVFRRVQSLQTESHRATYCLLCFSGFQGRWAIRSGVGHRGEGAVWRLLHRPKARLRTANCLRVRRRWEGLLFFRPTVFQQPVFQPNFVSANPFPENGGGDPVAGDCD